VRTDLVPLQQLLDVLEQPRSCVVLGAGASAPLVPAMRQLRQNVRRRVLEAGSFPAEIIARDLIAERVLGPRRMDVPPWDTAGQLREVLLAEHISPAAVQAATVALLVPGDYSRVPAQYAILNHSLHRMGIVNYNNDGLADRYCPKHIVVDVHGTTPAVGNSPVWNHWIDILLDFPGLSMVEIPGFHYPVPEPFKMAFGREYGKVERLLGWTKRLAIIGYSFGEQDDWIGYRRIVDVISRERISVVVVKPDARALVDRLNGDTGSRSALGLPAYWDRLACAILAVRSRAGRKSCDHCRLCARCIDAAYQQFMDSGLDWESLAIRLDLTPPVAD
jgi:hypothetical protein